jgi:peptidoglycan/LPS O-acetylase OafA/YrhL
MGDIKLNYRPEIDGLRAIAVVSVILYHANINIFNYKIFSGGFVGVDIFFVISGYLITSLILKELKTTGKFSFLNFYQRRAMRILPALFFVIAASLPFAWLYLLPGSLLDFSKSILYSIGFSSNYYFYFSNLQYGTEDSFLKPFLHTWSLSVEEQFYILFPVTIIIVYKFFKKNLFKVIISFIIISFISAIYTSGSNPSASFYFLHTRIWELLSGSILAYIEIKKKNKFSNKLLYQFGSLTGLVIITFSVFFLNDKISNTPLYLLLVIIGTCFVIKFCNKNNFTYNILSNKLFVNTGLISYSLYLWHYPIFAFYRYAFASGNILIKIFTGFLIVILSIFTYFYIEKKFRNKNVLKFYLFLSIVFIVIFIFIITIIKNSGFPNKSLIDGINLDQQYYISEIERWKKNKYQEINNNNKNIVIFGDSHAENFAMIFNVNKELFKDYNFRSIGKKEIILDYIYNYNSNNKDHLLIKKADIIIFSYKWDKEKIKNLDQIISLIQTKENKKIILTTKNPTYYLYGSRFSYLDFFLLKNKHKPNNDQLINLEKEYFSFYIKNTSRDSVNDQLMHISKNYNIKLLDKALYQCNFLTQTCLILTDHFEKINYDSNHHTLAGAKFLGEKIYNMNWFNID